MKLYLDSGDIAVMTEFSPHVLGYTTNPTLLKAAGVTDYEAFARQAVDAFPTHSISFEVIADDLPTMCQQAQKIASWGDNVTVKVPIMTTDGVPTNNLVWELEHEYSIKVNLTAVFTVSQALSVLSVTRSARPHIISVFAGRIADTGCDPAGIINEVVKAAHPSTEVLWASAREVFNVRQAFTAGADIITLSPDLLRKYQQFGKDLTEFSRETVQMFHRDAAAAGLTL